MRPVTERATLQPSCLKGSCLQASATREGGGRGRGAVRLVETSRTTRLSLHFRGREVMGGQGLQQIGETFRSRKASEAGPEWRCLAKSRCLHTCTLETLWGRGTLVRLCVRRTVPSGAHLRCLQALKTHWVFTLCTRTIAMLGSPTSGPKPTPASVHALAETYSLELSVFTYIYT